MAAWYGLAQSDLGTLGSGSFLEFPCAIEYNNVVALGEIRRAGLSRHPDTVEGSFERFDESRRDRIIPTLGITLTGTAVWAVREDGKLLHNWVERGAWERSRRPNETPSPGS